MSSVELTSLKAKHDAEIQKLTEQSGVDASKCYQCGKCSAGCPVAFAMDYMPREIIRMLQLGLIDEVLSSHTIWLCSDCIACYTRCPRSVQLPQLMDALRIRAREKNLAAEKNIGMFGDLLLGLIKRFGRIFEMGLIIAYNLKSRQPFKDVLLGPAILKRRKMGLLPHKIRSVDAVRKMFERVKEMESDTP